MSARSVPKQEHSESRPFSSGDGRLLFAFAHDLRSHLRVVLTRMQLMSGSSASTLSSEDKRMLMEATAAAGEIDGLLTAMETFCSVPSTVERVALPHLVQGASICVKKLLTEAGARLEAGKPPDVLVPSSLQVVLKELLTNACKFRQPQEPLLVRLLWAEVRSGDIGSTLEMTVTDNGIGIDERYAERIFEPFERLHSRSAYPGHGLGLAICRRILHSCGGDVKAMAGSKHGLSVRVRIPLEEPG